MVNVVYNICKYMVVLIYEIEVDNNIFFLFNKYYVIVVQFWFYQLIYPSKEQPETIKFLNTCYSSGKLTPDIRLEAKDWYWTILKSKSFTQLLQLLQLQFVNDTITIQMDEIAPRKHHECM